MTRREIKILDEELNENLETPDLICQIGIGERERDSHQNHKNALDNLTHDTSVCVSLVRKPKKWSNCGLVIKTFPLHSTLFFPHLKKFTLEIASRVEITTVFKSRCCAQLFLT